MQNLTHEIGIGMLRLPQAQRHRVQIPGRRQWIQQIAQALKRVIGQFVQARIYNPTMGIIGLGCHDLHACLQLLSTDAVDVLWMIRI
jgi:hypothetical protein